MCNLSDYLGNSLKEVCQTTMSKRKNKKPLATCMIFTTTNQKIILTQSCILINAHNSKRCGIKLKTAIEIQRDKTELKRKKKWTAKA